MKAINLLPTNQRKLRQLSANGLVQALLAFSLVVLLSLTGWLTLNNQQLRHQIKAKQEQKDQAKQSIERADNLTQQAALITDRKQSWQELQSKNADVETILKAIASATPEHTQVSNIGFDGKSILSIAGVAQSREEIRSFVTRLTENSNFSKVELNQANSQGTNVAFSLVVTLRQAQVSPSPTPGASK